MFPVSLDPIRCRHLSLAVGNRHTAGDPAERDTSALLVEVVTFEAGEVEDRPEALGADRALRPFLLEDPFDDETVRQRPGTAKGFVFLTLEDETGMTQAIVRPQLFRDQRAIIVGSTAPTLTISADC